MLPYATALLLSVEPSGRALVLTVPARGLFGGGVAALITLLSATWGLAAVVWVSGALIATTPLFVWLSIRASRR